MEKQWILNPIDKFQVKAELIAGDIKSIFAPVGVLTNLDDKYYFYWIGIKGEQFHLYELFISERKLATFIINLIMEDHMKNIMNSSSIVNITNINNNNNDNNEGEGEYPFLSRMKLSSRIRFSELADIEEEREKETDTDNDDDNDSEEEESENEEEDEEEKMDDNNGNKKNKKKNKKKNSKKKKDGKSAKEFEKKSHRLKYMKNSSSLNQCGWRIPTKSGKYLIATIRGPNEPGGVELTWDNEEKNYYFNQLGKIFIRNLHTSTL